MDNQRYQTLFLQEMRENAEAIGQKLVELEHDPENGSLVEDIMRLVHGCKGACRTMEHTNTADLCHAFEDLLQTVRDGTKVPDQEFITFSIEVIRAFVDALDSIQNTQAEPNNFELMSELHALTQGQGSDVGLQEETKRLQQESDSTAPTISSIRIATSKLDTLLNLAGELSLLHAQYSAECDQRFRPFLERFGQLSDSITYHILESRTVPAKQLLGPLPVMVRDLATEEKKQVQFCTKGDNIELDKTLVDHLATPLNHLLRNAVSHGIETPVERMALGKESQGTITISIARTQEHVDVCVIDDGADINVQAVKDRAKDRGFSSAELEDITSSNLLDTLCDPRFSAAKHVSTISGRGVGLADVRSTALKLGGELTLEQHSVGKSFTLSLPLNLSLIKAILVESDSAVYVIPFIHVERLLRLSHDRIVSMVNRPHVLVDDESIPLYWLGSSHCTDTSVLPVVLVDYGGQRIGVVVDAVIGTQSVLVKPLGDIAKQMQRYSGSTILHDGSIGLIIDIPSLIQEFSSP